MEEKQSAKGKKTRKWVAPLIAIILVFGYITYSFIIYFSSKSPDDISNFPTDGIWVAEENGFQITFNLENDEAFMTLTIIETGETFTLKESMSSGHGTIFVPTASKDILMYETSELETTNENYLYFSCSKFKFNENDFFFYDIYVYDTTNFSLIKNNQDLHFYKQLN